MHFCGGWIIHERWILTAAHCIEDIEEQKYTIIVKAGKYDLNVTESTEQSSNAQAYYKHGKFSASADISPYNIGLIKLKTPLKFNKYVAPIRLPMKNSEPSGRVILSGWGYIIDDGTEDGVKRSGILQKAVLEIVNPEICRKAVARAYARHKRTEVDTNVMEDAKTNICTGPPGGGVSPCVGDSGGSLISINKNGMSVLVGVHSWAPMPCGVKGGLAAYLRVSLFVEQIERIISNN